MKKIYFLVFVLCGFVSGYGQIVNIPDANFKSRLLAARCCSVAIARNINYYPMTIDINFDGEIQMSEALQVYYLDISDSKIANLSGIEYFNNLIQLSCFRNTLSTLDVTQLVGLERLNCPYNQITSLNLRNNTNLKLLYCDSNQITSLDLGAQINLENLQCGSNPLTSLDISKNVNLKQLTLTYTPISSLDCSQNKNLNTLFINNNDIAFLNIKNNNSSWDMLQFISSPSLRYICADDEDIYLVQSLIDYYRYTNCHVNSYCSFAPGGTSFVLKGDVKYDFNSNGCDINDSKYQNLVFSITNGANNGTVIANQSGEYNIPLKSGTHLITPRFQNTNYFVISPASLTVNFPSQASPFTQNFCITPNGVHPDLEVAILPVESARPGFDAQYKIIYKNKGNTTQSGTVNVLFNDAVLDLVSANPTASSQSLNNLSWTFTNLLPFETREIALTLNLNSPMEIPAVNGGDVLKYTTTIASAAIDDMPNDNTFTFNQTVVNSFDPNDKTCLEGNTITPDLIGQYVHYMIRFENNGTANAQNIVVKDMIDLAKFDINSIVPVKGSHSFVTNITAGNKVEFIFENINLPFDDANNDGYIAFKIKTLPTLVTGNTFTNEASIYFDYNFPIVTNKAATVIQTALSVQDFEFSNYFSVYPNPVLDVLNITSKHGIEVKSIAIYNTVGQLVLVIPNAQNVAKVDVSNLTTGNYFVKINSDKGTSNTKFIKN